MKEQVVNEWVERGKRDLDVAKLLLTKHDFFDIALFHIGFEIASLAKKIAKDSNRKILNEADIRSAFQR